jgi:hypothetical protein
VAESFFLCLCTLFEKSLKQELVYNTLFLYKKTSKKSHSYLGNLSPVKFEEKHEKQKVLQSEMVA